MKISCSSVLLEAMTAGNSFMARCVQRFIKVEDLT